MVACAKVIAFFAVLLFSLLLKKHYKDRFVDYFDMLIFSFLVRISRSITWPPQGRLLGHMFGKKWKKCGQVIDLEVFTCFLC